MKFVINTISNKIPRNFWDRVINTLPQDWDIREIAKTADIKEAMSDTDYYMGFPISSTFFKRNKKLKGLFLLSSQVPESYSKLSCEVINITGINAKAVAEHALYFSLRNLKERKLALSPDTLKVGLIGLGAVGAEIMKNHRPLFNNFEVMTRKAGHRGYDEYTAFIKEQDVLIISVSLNNETKDLFSNEKFFSHLKSDVTLINIARGELFGEEDLVSWFKSNPNSRYYTDVVYPEPYPEQGELNQYQNIFITPHQAGFYDGLWNDIFKKWETCSWIK